MSAIFRHAMIAGWWNLGDGGVMATLNDVYSTGYVAPFCTNDDQYAACTAGVYSQHSSGDHLFVLLRNDTWATVVVMAKHG